MTLFTHPFQWILGFIIIASSLGVILTKKPVHSSLFFLLSLLALAALYIQISAEFIGVMQILIYAGAILVLFMFVIVLFQDAHNQIERFKPKSSTWFLLICGLAFLLSLKAIWIRLIGLSSSEGPLPDGFGSVESLGKALYVDFFFPFEAVILLFLIAVVGALYIGKKARV